MITIGIERLKEYSDLFHQKRVGLITNPTGVDRDFVTTIDRLHQATNLVSLFSPEHGVRGDLQAGVRLDDYTDPETGCHVFSLYGATKEPTKEMMATIDVLAFDIQDVGARFYTYLYTLAYAMKACAKHKVPLVVFDRPNPLGGTTVEGTMIQDDCTSFVGNYHLLQRYGLTIGEYAQMINQEEGIHADLTVVPMTGYNRAMTYKDTGRHWVMPSPNIPTMETPLYYVSTCVFEGTNISEGRGTTKPFQIIGSPFFQAKQVLQSLRQTTLTGWDARELYFTPTFSKHANTLCNGIELYVTDESFEPVLFGMTLLQIVESIHDEFTFNKPYKEGLRPMIDLLVGDDFIRNNTLDFEALQQRIKSDTAMFREQKRRYHIYE